ncbi:MAG: hypothetical protein E7Y34_00065 [Mycoplasma sp.]|nr:hypothetical protein [Mycoplasma sp.]
MNKLIKTLKTKFWCLTILAPLVTLPLIGCSKALTEMEENVLKVWSTKEGNDKLYSWYLQKIYTNLNEKNRAPDDSDGNYIKRILYSNDAEKRKLNAGIKKFLNFILRQEIKSNTNFLNNFFSKLNNTVGGLNSSIIDILSNKIGNLWKADSRGNPKNNLDDILKKLWSTRISTKDRNVASNIKIEDSSNKWYNHSDIKDLINDHEDTTYADLLLWLVMSNPGNELDIKVWHMAIVDIFLSKVTESKFKEFWTDNNKNRSYESYVDDVEKDSNWLLNRRLLVEKLMLHWKLDFDAVKDKPETDEDIKIKQRLEKYEDEKNKSKDNKFYVEKFIKEHFILNSGSQQQGENSKDSLISFIKHKRKNFSVNKNDFWIYKDFGLDILNNSKNELKKISNDLKNLLINDMYGFVGIGEIPKSNDQWFDYGTKNITKKVEYQNLELAGILHKPNGKDNYNLITENGYEWPTIIQKGGKDNKETTGAVQYMIGLMPRYTKDNKKLTLEGTFLEGKEAELRMILGTREKVIKEALDYYEFEKEIKLEVPNILLNKIDWVSSWTKDRMKKGVNYQELKGNGERKPYGQGFLPYDWSYITDKKIEDIINETKLK